MDAAASPIADADFNEVCEFFLRIEDSTFPTNLKQKNTVIKYTKLPDFDYNSKVSWPQQSYTLQPRLRRIIALDDMELKTSRSLNPDIALPTRLLSSNYTKRKIVTITEDEEKDLHPKFSKEDRKSTTRSNRAVGTDFKEEKRLSQKTTSRLTSSSKNLKESKPSAKTSSVNNRRHLDASKTKHKNNLSNINSLSSRDNIKNQNIQQKVTNWNSKQTNVSPKISLSQTIAPPSVSEDNVCVNKNKLIENSKCNKTSKKSVEKCRSSKSPPQHNRSKVKCLKEISRNNPVTIIHVPLDEKCQQDVVDTEISQSILVPTLEELSKIDCGTEVDKILISKDVNIGTDPVLQTVDRMTGMEKVDFVPINKCNKDNNTQTEVIKESFDNLDIPNITLTKGDLSKENVVKFCSQSMPNLEIPSFKIIHHKDEQNNNSVTFCKSPSYIIRRATLTYTTSQKINFHVVDSSDETTPNLSLGPLAYPMNAVSVFKQELKNRELSEIGEKGDNKYKKKNNSNTNYVNPFNDLNSFNCSYVSNDNKLVKPSEIISTIRVNNGLLHSEYICEQFQRELNFIDSFFESLQYLENCSLSDQCFLDNKSGNWINNAEFDFKKSEYSNFLSNLENGTNIDDTETMASKSLCLLNLLIRDEQRRAKNLLFVLKMREDALKDFTKSQILWLENKKKQDNTDISTLKKKQRGALLKLQHECGEMQRMRKALLTLSEKRKAVLIKTKKNIELKLKSNVNLEQIFLGKKKLKRNTTTDRNLAPLKCFDLSSSGCDDSTTSRPKSEAALVASEVAATNINTATVMSAEKSIQTGESVLGTILVDQTTNTAAENFVVVDGGYLNILFHNLSLPQIFSSGKQYEVNEEALKNIVNSSNIQHSNLSTTDVFEKFIDQINNRDLDRSTTPSTARSLVEEFDQYYKGLTDEDKSPPDSTDLDYNVSSMVHEVKDMIVQTSECKAEKFENCNVQSIEIMNSDTGDTVLKPPEPVLTQSCLCDTSLSSVETQSIKGNDSETTASQTGPLPVPAGAAAEVDTTPPDVPAWLPSRSSSISTTSESSSSSNVTQYPSVASLSTLTSPVHCEAEELRRQQLAIEREIKALEQQQCQLLVVREIPDKPPPPYTPPTETRTSKPPRMFLPNDTIEEKIQKHIVDPCNSSVDLTDAFDLFVCDYCQDTLERQRSEQSDKPWDACNLLPQKQEVDSEKLSKITASELKDVLAGVTPTVVSGVGARRSDHIDDILFAEWRRCEPEWTSLHADEAVVKNQVFESIFQKILTETFDEYKKIVLNVTNEVTE